MIVLALLGLAALKASPVDRMYDYIDKAQKFSVDVESGVKGERGITGNYRWRYPTRQSYSIVEPNSFSYEFRQGPEYVFSIDHREKQYVEYRALGRLTGPADDFAPLLMSYPGFFVSLKEDKDRKMGFKAMGKKVIRGSETDVLVTGEERPLTAYVDSMGRVLRIEFEMMVQTGVVERFVDFSGHDRAGGAPIHSDIDLGYVPLTASRARTPGALETIRFGSLPDVKGGKVKSVDGVIKGKKAMLLLTSADCKPSAEMRAFLKKKVGEYNKRKIEVVEVRLGDKKGADVREWDVFWDEKGVVDKRADVPGTPFLFFIDKEGVIIRAWAGWADDQEEEFMKAFGMAFAPR